MANRKHLAKISRRSFGGALRSPYKGVRGQNILRSSCLRAAGTRREAARAAHRKTYPACRRHQIWRQLHTLKRCRGMAAANSANSPWRIGGIDIASSAAGKRAGAREEMVGCLRFVPVTTFVTFTPGCSHHVPVGFTLPTFYVRCYVPSRLPFPVGCLGCWLPLWFFVLIYMVVTRFHCPVPTYDYTFPLRFVVIYSLLVIIHLFPWFGVVDIVTIYCYLLLDWRCCYSRYICCYIVGMNGGPLAFIYPANPAFIVAHLLSHKMVLPYLWYFGVVVLDELLVLFSALLFVVTV